MKYGLLSFFILALVFVACTKEEEDVKLDPKVTTTRVMNISSDSATISGFMIAQGDGFAEKGVVYNTAQNPTTDHIKVKFDSTNLKASFSVTLRGLDYATKYYARAYAIGNGTTIYGEEISFTTKPVVPTISTTAITEITGNSAKSGGNITVSGGAEITKRGVVFGTEPNPTINGSKTEDGTGTGEFISEVTGLLGNTMYYLRSYATNSAGTAYGPELSFTTEIDFATVTTSPVSGIDKESAVSGGRVSYQGGGTVTERGVVYGLMADPTTDDTKIVNDKTGTGIYSSKLTGLEKLTTYHVRAYAINEAGTSYGENVEFTTEGDNKLWYVPGDYVAASYPGTSYADWTPGSSPILESPPTDGDNLEGYVYMANATNEFKITPQANWDIAYGLGRSPGDLDPVGGNLSLTEGYYYFKVDAAALKYTAVATVWGVIGTGSPTGGWDDDVDLTYNPESQTWRGVFSFTEGVFKFRGNDDWTYNYGSDDADGTLAKDEADIPIAVAADYVVELNLSMPLAYTYEAHHWGVIGDATSGAWDDDTDMTWDEGNGVLTVTLDLVAGEWKFRADDDWAINLGGDLNALEQEGANFAITEDGNYTITLDPWNKTGTIIKN